MNEDRMRATTIEALSLPEAWFLCLRATLTRGYEYRIDRGSFQGQRRRELDLAVVQIREPGIRPLVPDVPQGVPPPTTMDYVESYLPYLKTSVKPEKEQ